MTAPLRLATLVWIAGMATFFPPLNQVLEPLPLVTLERLAFPAVLLLLALELRRRPSVLAEMGRVEATLGLYLAVVSVSWIATVGSKSGLDLKRDADLLLTCFAMPAVAFFIGRHGRWSRGDVLTCCWVLVAGVGAYLVAIGLVQGFVDWRFLVPEREWVMHRNRARGPFANALPYSVMLALLLLVAVVAWTGAMPRGRRWLLAALMVGLVEALVLARLRVVWGGLVLALLFVAAASARARRGALGVVALLFALVGGGYLGLDASGFAAADAALQQPAAAVSQRLQDAEPIYNRVAVWATAVHMIRDRPLFGFGVGSRTFMHGKVDYYTSCCGVSWEWAVPCAVPHNEILNLLVLMGAVGLVVYLAFARELWRALSAARAAADADEAVLAVSVLGGFLLLAATAMMHDTMYLAEAQVLFFFLAGLVARTPAASDAGAARTAAGGAG